jgi:hypothetical protein
MTGRVLGIALRIVVGLALTHGGAAPAADPAKILRVPISIPSIRSSTATILPSRC